MGKKEDEREYQRMLRKENEVGHRGYTWKDGELRPVNNLPEGDTRYRGWGWFPDGEGDWHALPIYE